MVLGSSLTYRTVETKVEQSKGGEVKNSDRQIKFEKDRRHPSPRHFGDEPKPQTAPAQSTLNSSKTGSYCYQARRTPLLQLSEPGTMQIVAK